MTKTNTLPDRGKNTPKSFQPLETADRLPKGWKRVRLGDMCRFINGKAFKPYEWDTEGLPIIRIQNLNNPKATYNYWSGALDRQVVVNKGDVLFAWSGTPGTSFGAHIWAGEDGVLNQHIFKVLINTDVMTAEWFFSAVNNALEEIISKAHGGVGLRHVNKSEVEALEIPLPPLTEQQRIAGVLKEQMAAMEKARAAAEAQFEAARAMPAAYLREVFESEEAKGWKDVTLDEAARLLPSKSIASDGDAEVNAVTSACLTESGFDPAGIKVARMRSSSVPLCILEDNEILIARSNTPELVGRVSVYKGEPKGIVAADLTIRIMASDATSPDYLSMYLSYLYLTGYWRDHAGGSSSTMKKITRTQISALEIPLPDHSRQKIIADVLFAKIESARITLAIVQKELDAINALPGAILRKAFNGEL
ncbi:restriction endonuclease subunit S [Pontiella sulfatireligans]|uniref:Type-1 restriction enzyme EcoKI specificity protein n=1 Tax=Pontiella sulfatireligans TaxID=2750658 RepID=A0A6C2UFD1_9BACT|nr:restriction endonuclease subunit S [Pontiella sulfatireligans]VGO18131.1 Type-1 restriction enzyme EcoKI specificity protein [Pontiella sulfatireligans]